MVSLWCACELFNVGAYTLKSNPWKTIWWAKFELECLLLIFIYSQWLHQIFFFFLWGALRGQNAILRGQKSKNGWFLPFFSSGGASGGQSLRLGGICPPCPPWCHHCLFPFKIQSPLQKLLMPVHQNPTEENPSKISNITFAIFLFLIKKLQLNWHPEYLWVYFSWWDHQIRFKWFILTQRTRNL